MRRLLTTLIVIVDVFALLFELVATIVDYGVNIASATLWQMRERIK